MDRDLNAAKMILKQGMIQSKLPLERREVKRVDLEEIRLKVQSAKVETRSRSPKGER